MMWWAPRKMVFHVRHVLKCRKGNPGLREGSIELCSMGGLLGINPKSHKRFISIRNGKAYEYLIKDNIQLV